MKRGKPNEKYVEFKSKHPKLHMANAFVSMFLPFCLVVLCFLIFGVVEDRSILGVYSIAGSLALGVGLTLCVATDYDKEVLWRLNIYPILIGAIVTFSSTLCACGDSIALNFDKKVMTFQLVCYISAFWSIICYFIAREAITDHICTKTKLTEVQLDKRKNGFFNFLWYLKIHKEKWLGWIFYFNVLLTTVLILFLIGTGVLAFLRPFAETVMLLGALSAALMIVLEMFVLITARRNKKSYHTPNKKKLLARIPMFYEIMSMAITIMLAWLQLREYLAL